MAAIDPIHQFQVTRVVPLPPVDVPGLGMVDLSITNSVLSMMIATALIIAFFAFAARGAIVPGRLQTTGEMLYGMIHDLADSMIGHDGKKFFPFVFALFSFVLVCNLLGLFLVFTATSQLAVTAALAVITLALVIGYGLFKHGLGFFKLFVPSDVPIFILPFLVIIEVLSFALRPFTLALRLFGNMLGGHIVLKIFAAFVVALGAFAAGGGLATVGYLGSAVSLAMVVALTALEFLVAFLQAFVFASLACVYLNDVVNLHEH